MTTFSSDKRVVIDLDGTICEEVPTFERCMAQPKSCVVTTLNDLKQHGYFIIIYTARGWAEYKMTKDWLKTHNIPHDLLLCGKPLYNYWIDDRALNARDWDEIRLRLCSS